MGILTMKENEKDTITKKFIKYYSNNFIAIIGVTSVIITFIFGFNYFFGSNNKNIKHIEELDYRLNNLMHQVIMYENLVDSLKFEEHILYKMQDSLLFNKELLQNAQVQISELNSKLNQYKALNANSIFQDAIVVHDTLTTYKTITNF